MIYNYIGDKAMKHGLNTYLTRHSYKNTQTKDLWKALEEASNLPVTRIMSSWTQQKGYPVVSVSVKEVNSSVQKISLHQEKFNQNGSLSEDDKKTLWSVPLSIVSQSSSGKKIPLSTTLFDTRDLTLSLEVPSSDWFKLNPSVVDIYRTNYSPELYAKLAKGITSKQIAPLDRLSILDDLYALTLAGQQSSVELFKFVAAYKEENDYTVWFSLYDVISKYNQLLAGAPIYEKYRKWAIEFINSFIAPYIGWEEKTGEPYLEKLLRSLVNKLLVSLEDEKTLAHCVKLFKGQVDSGVPIPVDLRESVYRGVASKADATTFQQLMKVCKVKVLNRISKHFLCRFIKNRIFKRKKFVPS